MVIGKAVRWDDGNHAFRDLQRLGITDIIFDCDGVIWLGDQPIAGAIEALEQLAVFRRYFLTNHSSKSSQYLTKRLNLLGVTVEEGFAFSSAKLAALAVLGLPGFNPEVDSVFVVGEEGLISELQRHSIKVSSEGNVKAVVVGYDEKFDFEKLHLASLLLRNRPEVAFLACSLDGQLPRGDVIRPGTGASVAAIAKASDRTPVLVGKPSKIAFQVMQQLLPHLRPETTLMVGDRLSSDIAFGRACGMFTLLVETGIHEEDAGIVADFVASSLAIFKRY